MMFFQGLVFFLQEEEFTPVIVDNEDILLRFYLQR